MKKSDIPAEILNAGPCVVGEYRGSKVERVEYVDKNDGKAKSFVKATHLFEIGTGGSVQSIRVEEPVPRTVQNPAEVAVPYKRGAFYLLRLAHFNDDWGKLEARLVAGAKVVEVTG